MKPIKLITILSLLVIFLSCKKNNFEHNNPKINNELSINFSSISLDKKNEKLLFLITDSIGIYHNLCMEYLSNYFDSLKNVNLKIKETELNSLIKNKTIEFFKKKNVIAYEEKYNIVYNYNNDILSKEANGLLSKIDSLINISFNANSIDLENLTYCLKSIQKSAITDLNLEEALIVGSAASVGYNSFEFWCKMANKYSIYGNQFDNSIIPLATNNQREVGKADINGAVYGGIGGAFGGAAGIIVGASVGAAYKSFIKAFEVTKKWDLWWMP